VCGKASGEEELKEHSFGACSPVICVKPDETARGISVGDRMSVMCSWLNIYCTGIRTLTGMVQLQFRECTPKDAIDI
jgi:hypothetical protein